MKKKDIQAFAKKIAKAEMILQDENASSDEKAQATATIITISNKVTSFEDLMLIEECVYNILSKS